VHNIVRFYRAMHYAKRGILRLHVVRLF